MKKIALVGGGTGGHIIPLLSIYNFLKNDKTLSFIWIGENNSLEEKISTQNNIRFFGIKSGKLRRYFSLKTIFEPFKIIYGIIQSILLLKKQKIQIIFSKGGYVSLPVAIASQILGIKIFLHESDTIPGLANRIVGRFANKIFLGFDSAKKYFDGKKCEVVGQILNKDLFSDLNFETNFGNTNLLIIGGSQGSTRIFEFLLKNINKFKNFNIDIVLGSLNTDFKKKFETYKFVKTYDFINHDILKNLYAKADIALTRAGATNLAELDVFGIKMIIVPLSESANNHQYYNALEYDKKGSVVILEKDLNEIGVMEILKFEKFKKKVKEFKYNYEIVKKIAKEIKIRF